MPFSLINDPWIPVRRAHSGASHSRPADLTANITTDPVLAINWPRADFRLATLEFLIGLLAVACPPTGRRDWPASYHNPPSPTDLEAAFAPLAFAFELDGDGPRFMQDFDDLTVGDNDVATLLIESPGEQTLKKNADLLVKRGQVLRLSRASAAMALFTLQTYAPAGGAGNRTGLRGGGPLTTLVVPAGGASLPLWHRLWANVPTGQPAHLAELPHIFPWLTKTKTSENNKKIVPNDPHDRLAFWGAPRRIRLNFSSAQSGETCDLTGQADTVMVRSWRQRPNGANYDAFKHPLTPYYRPKPKESLWLPVHPQPDGIGYKDYLGLLIAPTNDAETLKPAATIATWRGDRARAVQSDDGTRWGILAAGFDMDNMKARGFVETELPVIDVANPDDIIRFDEIVTGLVRAADEVAALLRQAVRGALFSEGSKPEIKTGLFNDLRAQFWQETEPAFYHALGRAADGVPRDAVSSGFLARLRPTAFRLFDQAAPITVSTHPDRVARAAKWLGVGLNGYGKAGRVLFSVLGLEAREEKPKRKSA